MSASDADRERSGIPARAREYLRRTGSPGASERKWLEHARHHLLPFTDPRYPKLLRSFPRHPVALYAAGSIDALCDPQLAVVGSRNPTPQGLDTAHAFAERLAEHGLSITSGLAAGIDTAAHRGALAAQGFTLAVLGNGLDIVYPRSNSSLSEAIEQQGARVSEFPLGTAPRRGNFPQRNRIIAGLSLGTLVVEAARNSGSLITARVGVELDHRRLVERQRQMLMHRSVVARRDVENTLRAVVVGRRRRLRADGAGKQEDRRDGACNNPAAHRATLLPPGRCCGRAHTG